MCAWMSRDGSDRINGDRINGLFHSPTYKWAMNRAVITITHFLTIDPNFLGHPRVISVCVCVCPFGMMDTLPKKLTSKALSDPTASTVCSLVFNKSLTWGTWKT